MSVHRHSPLTLPSGKTLQNRLVVPPMASQTADTSGLATEQTLTHYARLAESGAGLVMVEYSYVSPDGRSEPNQLGAHVDACIPGLSQIANTLHSAGTRCGLQLTHCGGKGSLDVTVDMMGPSGITVPAYDRELERPREMTLQDIHNWQRDFVIAAGRAEQAGFDFVEIHCAHGYGINQWMSPITNQRDDNYGGSLECRARLLLEIIREIREQHPTLGLMCRIPGQDNYPGGLSTQDMQQVAQWLTEAGVEIIDVSSGIGGWKRPKERRGEGYLVDESHAMRTVMAPLNIPVIGVGGIESAAYMEKALAEGWLDLAAVGRAILKDPAAFKQSHMRAKQAA